MSSSYDTTEAQSLLVDPDVTSVPVSARRVAASTSPGTTTTTPTTDTTTRRRSTLRTAIALGAPFWSGAATRRRAWALTAGCLLLSLLSNFLLVRFSYAQRDFSTALQKKDVPGFYDGIRQFLVVIAFACPLFALASYVKGWLRLAWRRELTSRLLGGYLSHEDAFYHLKMTARGVDNPDQRIAEDSKNFVIGSVDLLVLMMDQVLSLVSFIGVLYSISPRLVYFLLVYSVVGTAVTLGCFGRKLVSVQQLLLGQEADLRLALVRIREGAESLAFLKGVARERDVAVDVLEDVLTSSFVQLRWLAGLDVFNNCCRYFTIVIPSLAIAPLFFAGKVEFGVIAQAGYAFSTVRSALLTLVTRFQMFSALGAEALRLAEIVDVLDDLNGTDGGAAKGQAPRAQVGVDVGGGAAGAGPARGGNPLSLKLRSSDDDTSAPLAADVDDDTRVGAGGKLRRRHVPRRGDASPSGSEARRGVAHRGGHGGGGGIQLRHSFDWSDHLGSAADGDEDEEDDDQDDVVLAARRLVLRIPSPSSNDAGAFLLPPPGLNLTLRRGQRLLIVGRTGCGKSSLLRAVAGLWRTGGGSVTRPRDDDCFFLPQRPYVALRGSLRDQLLFPATAASSTSSSATVAPTSSLGQRKRTSDGSGGSVSDDDIYAIVDRVGLSSLARRCGSLDARQDWRDMLSGGELQRLSFARLLLRRPLPRICFLDEATSACDEGTEARMYAALMDEYAGSARRGDDKGGPAGRCTFVSVGHRSSLRRFHSHVLTHRSLGRGGPGDDVSSSSSDWALSRIIK